MLRKTDHRHIHHDWREGRGDKMAMGVQGAGLQRDERDEQKIWKGDPCQRDGEREFFRIGPETWRQQIDDIGRESPGEREQDDLGCEQPDKNLPREEPRTGKTLALQDPRIAWHIGGVESPFAKNRAKMVGQTLSDGENIVDPPTSKHGGRQDIAQKARAAREQGQTADGNQAFVHE